MQPSDTITDNAIAAVLSDIAVLQGRLRAKGYHKATVGVRLGTDVTFALDTNSPSERPFDNRWQYTFPHGETYSEALSKASQEIDAAPLAEAVAAEAWFSMAAYSDAQAAE